MSKFEFADWAVQAVFSRNSSTESEQILSHEIIQQAGKNQNQSDTSNQKQPLDHRIDCPSVSIEVDSQKTQNNQTSTEKSTSDQNDVLENASNGIQGSETRNPNPQMPEPKSISSNARSAVSRIRQRREKSQNPKINKQKKNRGNVLTLPFSFL